MDLASPLRSLIPSLDSAVLELLAGTESGLSVSAIARLSSRGSRSGQAAVLDRLVRHGLVIADPANRGSLYRLNRRHVLADLVVQALGARAAVLRRLTDAVGALQPEPVHASVFGSFARREGSEHSDIDVLLVVDDDVDPYDAAWQDQVHRLADDVRAWTGNHLEVLVLTAGDLPRLVTAGEPVLRSLRREGLHLHGRPLEPLLDISASAGPVAPGHG